MARPKMKKDDKFNPSPDTERVISLNQGTWAYVFDAEGKKHHVKRTSEAMVIVCREADAALGGKISASLEKLGWADVLKKMKDAE